MPRKIKSTDYYSECLAKQTSEAITSQIQASNGDVSEDLFRLICERTLKSFREYLKNPHQQVEKVYDEDTLKTIADVGIQDQKMAKIYQYGIDQAIADTTQLIKGLNPDNARKMMASIQPRLEKRLRDEAVKHHTFFERNVESTWVEKPINLELERCRYVNYSLIIASTAMTIAGAFSMYSVLIIGILILAISMSCHHLLVDKIEKNNREQLDVKSIYNI